jgi:hypothetical protein
MRKSKPRSSRILDPCLAGRILLKLDYASAAIFAKVLRLAYNEDEPRDEDGEWTDGEPSEVPTEATPAKPIRPKVPSSPSRRNSGNSAARPAGTVPVATHTNLHGLTTALDALLLGHDLTPQEFEAAIQESQTIATCIEDYYNRYATAWSPRSWDSERNWGYWCYQWAFGFENAFNDAEKQFHNAHPNWPQRFGNFSITP